MNETYEELLECTDGAMVVVTVFDGRERAGCLVGFHVQAGIEPPRHALWLSKANHTYRVALHATHMAVHFLTTTDKSMARAFGEFSGDEVDKFAGVDWSPGPEGTPLLDELPNRFVGRRVALLDVGGDHACLVVEVDDANRVEAFDPLRFGTLGDLSPGHASEDRPVPTEVRTPETA